MRHNRTGNISGRNSFNPRICKRCDSFQIQFSATKIRFNPRICKRCDLAVMYGYIFCSVSIHASVKDATSLRNFIMFRSFVSIHASVKDATYGKEIEVADPAFVSIHASVKDATRCCSSCRFNYLCFNPRICKRCDFMPMMFPIQTKMFQSTHL